MFLLPETLQGFMLFSLMLLGGFALWCGFLIALTIYDNRRYAKAQIRRRKDEQIRRDREEQRRRHEEILMEIDDYEVALVTGEHDNEFKPGTTPIP